MSVFVVLRLFFAVSVVSVLVSLTSNSSESGLSVFSFKKINTFHTLKSFKVSIHYKDFMKRRLKWCRLHKWHVHMLLACSISQA